jgi:hypothetical protein
VRPLKIRHSIVHHEFSPIPPQVLSDMDCHCLHPSLMAEIAYSVGIIGRRVHGCGGNIASL